jgi:TPR repeat protein
MIKPTKFYLMLVMSLILGLGSAMAQQKTDKPVIGMDGVALDSATLEKLSVQALDGSGEAARKVSIHYLMTQKDRKKAIYWALIAAENGDSVGQYHVGFLLKDDPDPNNRRRAIFWLKKSLEQGEHLAQELLQEIQSKKGKPVRGRK